MKRVTFFRVLTGLSVLGFLFFCAKHGACYIASEDIRIVSEQLRAAGQPVGDPEIARIQMEGTYKECDNGARTCVVLFVVSLAFSFQRRPRVRILGCAKPHDAAPVEADLCVRLSSDPSPAATEPSDSAGEVIETQTMSTKTLS